MTPDSSQASRRGGISPGRFVWHEILTSSPEETADYFSKVFPWSYGVPDESDATEPDEDPVDRVIQANGQSIGAIRQRGDDSSLPPHWICYVTVSDLTEACQAAAEGGAQIVSAPRPHPHVGTAAVLTDPQGGIVGLCDGTGPDVRITSPPLPRGVAGWHELLSCKPDESAAFYRAVLPFRAERFDLGPTVYHVFKRGDENAAGILAAPADADHPAAWIPYFTVPDCGEAARRAEEAGGAIRISPTDIPGVGRFCISEDPRGAVTALFQLGEGGETNGEPYAED